MPTEHLAPYKSKSTSGLDFSTNQERATGYTLLLLFPSIVALVLSSEYSSGYEAVLTFANTTAMAALFAQFLLSARIHGISWLSSLTWNTQTHQRTGLCVGVFFLFHPLLSLIPDVINADSTPVITDILFARDTLPAQLAWCAMLIWTVLFAFKDRLPFSDKVWRITVTSMLLVISVFATMHLTAASDYGKFQERGNQLWWALCFFSYSLVTYCYAIKPVLIHRRPFKLLSTKKISRADWELTLELPKQALFEFQSGQIAWLNTNAFALAYQHRPCSILSYDQSRRTLSLIVRASKDGIRSLESLHIGQNIYLDGPYTGLPLAGSQRAKGITLIAGGCGIGPIMSLLRKLASEKDPRPIRLVYGNKHIDQMVFQEEIAALELTMPDFKGQLVCQHSENTQGKNVSVGIVDQSDIEKSINQGETDNWAVYLCGSQPMVFALRRSLSFIGIPKHHVYFEHM